MPNVTPELIERAITERAKREGLWSLRLGDIDLETMSEEIIEVLQAEAEDPLDKARGAMDAAKLILDQYEGDTAVPTTQHDRIHVLLIAAQIHTNTQIALETGRLANAVEALKPN